MPSSPPEPAAAALSVEIVAPERLAALGPEWSALWRRCPTASPFQAPEWLLPWARHYAPGRCGAVALRRAGRLAGLAPVFCWERALLLAGTGPSDRADVLIEPGAEPAVGRLLAALPQAACEPFDRIDLRQLPSDSPALSACALGGWREERRADVPCLVAALQGQDGLGAASSNQRKRWRYALRRLEREQGAVEVVRCGEREVAAAMEQLARLHGLRWRDRGAAGVLSDPLLACSLRDAAPALARAALLRLYRARLGDRPIAALMVLAGGRAHSYYIGGFDPAFARLSPSAVLIGTAMVEAHREGATEFDFLRGAEDYKFRWGAGERPTHRRILIPPAVSRAARRGRAGEAPCA
jgi:CelD/BcsL family acetyltransferase involved in cellulose biosynthesis